MSFRSGSKGALLPECFIRQFRDSDDSSSVEVKVDLDSSAGDEEVDKQVVRESDGVGGRQGFCFVDGYGFDKQRLQVWSEIFVFSGDRGF